MFTGGVHWALRNVARGFFFAFMITFQVGRAIARTLSQRIRGRMVRLQERLGRLTGLTLEELKHRMIGLIASVAAANRDRVGSGEEDGSRDKDSFSSSSSSRAVYNDGSLPEQSEGNETSPDVEADSKVAVAKRSLSEAFSSTIVATDSLRGLSPASVPFSTLFLGLLLNVLSLVLRRLYDFSLRSNLGSNKLP